MGLIELIVNDFVFIYHFCRKNTKAVIIIIIVAIQAAKFADPPDSPTNSE